MPTYQAADAWVALADGRRRAIVERLSQGPLAVGELARDLPVSRPAVSQHLKVLPPPAHHDGRNRGDTTSAEGQPTLMDMARAERTELAAFLATLTPKDWQARSLCDRWTVKDVVAHTLSYEELDVIGLIKRFVKGRVVRANEVGVEEFAPMSPDELPTYLNSHLQPRGLTARFGEMIALVDGTIHRQDIRRALGRPRTVPVDRLERILPLVPGNPRLGVGKRIRGLRLQATDVEWSHGSGPEVAGVLGRPPSPGGCNSASVTQILLKVHAE